MLVTLWVLQLVFCQRINPIILNKISELVSSGNDDIKEVQRALSHYIKHTLPKEHNITPISSDRAFYPLPNDIKNHVGNAKRALEMSKLDQENLQLKIAHGRKIHHSLPTTLGHILNKNRRNFTLPHPYQHMHVHLGGL